MHIESNAIMKFQKSFVLQTQNVHRFIDIEKYTFMIESQVFHQTLSNLAYFLYVRHKDILG